MNVSEKAFLMQREESMEGLQLLLVAPVVAMNSGVEDKERNRTALGTEVAP